MLKVRENSINTERGAVECATTAIIDLAAQDASRVAGGRCAATDSSVAGATTGIEFRADRSLIATIDGPRIAANVIDLVRSTLKPGAVADFRFERRDTYICIDV
jgi:hypothetical protein